MSATDQFRHQHKEIMVLAGEISSLALPRVREGSETAIKAKLSALAGKLGVHLAMEDRSLYPQLIASSNAVAHKTATTFQQQMGGIAVAFKAFVGKYPTGKTIADNGATFSGDFKTILTALQTRIGKEESALYPLADAL